MKTPLVLISGLLSNEYLWRHQVKYLNEITAISFFNPNQDNTKEMVEAILKEAPPTFALAGHSMGGWLCLEILRVAPSRVSKVCLLNTTARDDSEEKKAKRQAMIARCREGQFEEIINEITPFFTENPAVRREVEKMFLDVGCEAFTNQEKAMLNRDPCESVLSSICCPALVIHAAQDKNFTLKEHEELVEKIPNAKLAIIEDSGHMSPLEVPQAVTSLLRFWLTYL